MDNGPRTRQVFRFTFSLRTFFVLVTVLGVSLGWFGVQWKWIHDRQRAREWIGKHGFQLDVASPSGSVPSAPWPILLFEPGVSQVYLILESDEEREKVAELKRLFPEAQFQRVKSLPTTATREWQVMEPL